MEGLDRLRDQAVRLAAQRIGKDANQPRFTVGQARAEGFEADIVALPIVAEGWRPLQDADGNFYFMVDVSDVDGGDLLA